MKGLVFDLLSQELLAGDFSSNSAIITTERHLKDPTLSLLTVKLGRRGRQQICPRLEDSSLSHPRKGPAGLFRV